MPDAVRWNSSSRPHEAGWPDMVVNLQSAYSELTRAQFVLEHHAAEIEAARDLFLQVIESMSEALFLMDRTGCVVRVNPAAVALLECEEANLVGRPFATVHFSLEGELSVMFPCGFVGSAPGPAGEALPDDCASRKMMRNAATTISTGPIR